MGFLLLFLVGLALNVVAYLLLPKPKQSQDSTTTDMENPTADASRPIPKIFGSMRINGLNFLWYGEKEKDMVKLKTGNGKTK